MDIDLLCCVMRSGQGDGFRIHLLKDCAMLISCGSGSACCFGVKGKTGAVFGMFHL